MTRDFYLDGSADGTAVFITDDRFRLLYASNAARRSGMLGSRLGTARFTLPRPLKNAAAELLSEDSATAGDGEHYRRSIELRIDGKRCHAVCERRDFCGICMLVFAIYGRCLGAERPKRKQPAEELPGYMLCAAAENTTDVPAQYAERLAARTGGLAARRFLSACFAPRCEKKGLYRASGLLTYWYSSALTGVAECGRTADFSSDLPEDGYCELCGEALVTVLTAMLSVLLKYTEGTVHVRALLRKGGFTVNLYGASPDGEVLRSTKNTELLCRTFGQRLPQILTAAEHSRRCGFGLAVSRGAGTELRFELDVNTFDIGEAGFKATSSLDGVRTSARASALIFL